MFKFWQSKGIVSIFVLVLFLGSLYLIVLHNNNQNENILAVVLA